MSARKSSPRTKRRLFAAASLLPVLAMGACGADYRNRYDSVTSSAGNAAAHNKVVHTADPWPRAAADNRIGGNGQRVDAVTKRYLAGPAAAAASSAPATAAAPGADQAPPSPNAQ